MKTMKQFRSPVQSSDLTVKEYMIYNREDSITTALQYLYTDRDGNHHLAVGRAYCSPTDQWCKAQGRDKALKRLRKFIDNGRAANFKHITQWSGNDQDKAMFPFGTILFESGQEDILSPEEAVVYRKSIKPKLDRYYFDTGHTEIKFESVVNWATDKYVQESIGVVH